MGVIERFKEKFVQRGDNECWEWKAGKVGNTGYGKFKAENGKTVRAHRFAWEVFVEPIPDDVCVLHECNNKLCVNPNHLYLGSHSDNAGDRMKAGAVVKSQPLLCKLYDEEVWLVRRLLAYGVTQTLIAKMFKVSRVTVRRIRDNINFSTRGSCNA